MSRFKSFMLKHLTVWLALVVGFAIGAIVLGTLYGLPDMGENEWANFWQVVGSGLGAMVGGYIAYIIAKYQSKSDRIAAIKSLFLQNDINSCVIIVEELNSIVLELDQLIISLINQEIWTAEKCRAYKERVNQSNVIVRSGLRKIRTNFMNMDMGYDLRLVSEVLDRHKELANGIEHETDTQNTEFLKKSGDIIETSAKVLHEVRDLVKRVESKLVQLRQDIE